MTDSEFELLKNHTIASWRARGVPESTIAAFIARSQHFRRKAEEFARREVLDGEDRDSLTNECVELARRAAREDDGIAN